MATIEKMKLYGLRNFAPYEEHTQSIEFSSPLTLILGKNGCGKTTLIEALKFACSGDLPGGTNSGQGFVHDPKLHSTSSTKGQVYLKFVDASGTRFIVVKSVRVVNKGATFSFKRLDSTLKRINPDGVEQSLSSRYAASDAEICNVFGVSKAILNSVIFCHQEDSAWPLDEPKKLKERFDEIFEASKYNKLVENINDIKKTEIDKNKILQRNVERLQEIKETVDGKQAEMQKKQQTVENNEKVIKEGEERLSRMKLKTKEIIDLKNYLDKLQSESTEKETLKKSAFQQQDDILKNILFEYAETEEELQEELTSFKNRCIEIEEEHKSLLEKKEIKDTQKAQSISLIQELKIEMGKLENEKTHNQKNIVECNSLIEQLANNLKVEVNTNLSFNEIAVDGINIISRAIETSKLSLDKLTVEFDKEESKLQDVVDKCRDNISKTNQSIESKTTEIQEIDKKQHEISSELSKLEYSDEQLKTLENNINDIDKDLKELKSFDVDLHNEIIENNKQKLKENQEKLDVLEREYENLQENYITETKIEFFKHEIVKHETEIHSLKNNHLESLREIFGTKIPHPGSINENVEQERLIHGKKVDEINNKIKNKLKETTMLETKCKLQKDKLLALEKELDENQKKVFELCGEKSFDAFSIELYKIHKEIESLQNNKRQYSSTKSFYEQFLKDFQNENACCPVCKTTFINKQEEVNQIVVDIKNKIQGIPQELEMLDKKLCNRQEYYSNLLQLKPVTDRIHKLNTSDIGKAKLDLSELENLYERVSQELVDYNNEIISSQTIVDACNKVFGDSKLIDRLHLEIDSSKMRITDLESQLRQEPSNHSIQQAEAEIKDIRVDQANIRQNCDAFQNKVQQHTERCQSLRERRNKHVEEQLIIQKVMQGKPQLQEQLSELKQKKQTFETDIEKLRMQLVRLKLELIDAKKAKDVAKTNHKKTLQEVQKELNDNRNLLKNVLNLQSFVNEYVTKDVEGSYCATLEELGNLKNKIKRFDEDIEKINNKLSEINKQLASQNTAFRNLKDNLSLKQKQKEIENLSTEIADLSQQIGRYNYHSLLAEEQKFLKEDKEITEKINIHKGRNDQLHQEIVKLRTELDSIENKEVHSNYKKALFEQVCSKKKIKNLELYINALELGIIELHKERMTQINKIIRHLWRSIYRGNDCDYIEIKTDETKSSGLKRIYNYKVVQIKSDVEIDMRGRCSAGQKVLACLVIRMALAETFSKNCGILALDEPTTNLDRANINGLSEALARIVNNCLSEKNFQLLVITHDEEFLNIIKTRVDNVSFFYRVDRNQNGNSIVTREML